MLTRQLTALPAEQASALLTMLNTQLKRGQLANPLGWLLSMMKCAREGRLVLPAEQTEQSAGRVILSETAQGGALVAMTPMVVPPAPELPESLPAQAASKASQEKVSNLVADIRARILTAGK
nr:hypothetical protein PJ912_16270 [Pectobacterium colocasium]